MKKKENKFVINEKVFGIFIDRTQIRASVRKLALEINKDYADKKPLFVIVLKGSIFFASDLLRMIKLPCDIETISAKSYGKKMKSSGFVELCDKKLDVKGRDVIIIEDIADTGLTLKTLVEVLNQQKPASIEAVAFLSKPSQRKVEVNVKYIGIEILPDFVVGYGLDYAEQGRQLPDIYKLEG